jgi:hypothetical protein
MPRTNSTHKSTPNVPKNTLHTTTPTVSFPNPLSSIGNTVPVLPKPSFAQTLKEGLAFGTGQAVAHRMVGSLLGYSGPPQQEVKRLCEKELVAFESCMKTKSTDDFCGEQQMAYTQCLNLEKKD